MPKRDLTFEIIRLLSQRIVSDSEKYPEGEVIRKTSCMNLEDAELIGYFEAIKTYLDPKTDAEIIEELDSLETFFERVGLARWIKGELTHLGFRAGLRYLENISLEDQAVDEAIVLGDKE